MVPHFAPLAQLHDRTKDVTATRAVKGVIQVDIANVSRAYTHLRRTLYKSGKSVEFHDQAHSKGSTGWDTPSHNLAKFLTKDIKKD